MIGLDTNILIRHLTQDDPAQSRKATQFIKQHLTRETPGFINRVVLCELVWVLESAYHYPKASIVTALEHVFRTSQFHIEDLQDAWRALRLYQNGLADFADCLLGVINRRLGCERTMTFDHDAARLDPFELLKNT
jgi:predicted nucleic-acid-binding protein